MSKRPEWLKVRVDSSSFKETFGLLQEYGLHTICEEAVCPNIAECWKNRSVTFLVMGKVCTRSCKFCLVQCGAPEPLDDTEPERLAKCIKRLELKYVVLTSVARDDLADGGSGHIAEIVSTIKDQCPETKVEVLLSDFGEDHGSIRVIVHSKPDVFGHNLETVRRMHKRIKTPPSDYDTSLRVLKFLKENTQLVVKTGIMVGIGEKSEEVCDTLEDVARIGVDICTIGQYMTPSINHYPVQKYYELSEFQEFKRIGEEKGIKCVISGPFVRSSYGANQTFELVCPGENSFFRTTQSY